MPKIMIEGMEMPKSCLDCRFCIFQMDLAIYCSAINKCVLEIYDNERHPNCPLKEVNE